MLDENFKLKDGFKVVHLIDNSFQSDSRVEKELGSLMQLGVQILVCAIDDQNLPKKEVRNGYYIYRIFPKSLVSSYYKFGYKSKMNKIIGEIPLREVIVVHCHDFMMLRIGVLMKIRYPNLKLIYDSHEYLKGWPYYRNAQGYLNQIKGFCAWTFFKWCEKKDAKKANKIITINDQIASKLKKHLRLKQKPLVVGNYLSKKSLSVSNKVSLKKLLNINNDELIIIHSGSIYLKEKDLRNLLIEIRMFQGKKINLVFMGNTEIFFRLKSKFENENELHFIDFPHNINERISILSSANIGLLYVDTGMEAHRIGFSNRFIEYISAGIPVIANYQEFVVKFNSICECCQIFKNVDNQNLKISIEKLLNNETFYRKNIKNNRNKIYWENHEEVFLNYYKSALT